LHILDKEFSSDRVISRLIRKYQIRHLYKRCYVLTDTRLDDRKRENLSSMFHLNLKGERGKHEKQIARKANIPHEAVIIYAPPPSMNLKEANVLVKIDRRAARPLSEWQNKEVMSLQEKFGKLWKFYVFVDPEFAQRFSVISAQCETLFEMENELPLIQKGQLSLFPF
ncbi:hypothetical protein JW979_12625, partial [bacterium]|nr:hypothetical protein [candidate division CSSED10-310 bacterium]